MTTHPRPTAIWFTADEANVLLDEAISLAKEVIKAQQEVCLLGPMSFGKSYVLAKQFLKNATPQS